MTIYKDPFGHPSTNIFTHCHIESKTHSTYAAKYVDALFQTSSLNLFEKKSQISYVQIMTYHYTGCLAGILIIDCYLSPVTANNQGKPQVLIGFLGTTR